MKAYLIDPASKEIIIVDFPTKNSKGLDDVDTELASIYANLKCNTIDIVRFCPSHFLFVDDNGLLGDLKKQSFFTIKGYPGILAGRALMLRQGKDGDSESPTFPIDLIRENVAWLTLDDCMAMSGGKFPPKIQVTFFK